MQFAGAYGETGVRYTLAVAAGDAQALSRQVRPWQFRRHSALNIKATMCFFHVSQCVLW